MPELGKLLLVLGLVIALGGLLLWTGLGSWVGKLPGDICIERGSSGFYFPIVTCTGLSIILSILFALFRR